MVDVYDFGVIGAGFFGVRLALLLSRRGARVVLIERSERICSRATYANQARVHNGYHYTRSYSTALGSHRNYDRFLSEMDGCIDDHFDHIYGIARSGSYTNAYQFQRFCRELGLPLRRAPKCARRLFDFNRIEEIFMVRECAFNAAAIQAKLARDLDCASTISLKTRTVCNKLTVKDGYIALNTSSGQFTAKGVFIVTFAESNSVLRNSGLTPLDLKAEIAELCVVGVPSSLRRIGITVMDGPFFSLMPMPAIGGHSLSHVRYTPHLSWDLSAERYCADSVLDGYGKQSRFVYMRKDAERFVPELNGLTYRQSLFETKAIPRKHELDDGRPIIFHRHLDDPPCISILGSKIDSVFELERAVAAYLEGELER